MVYAIYFGGNFFNRIFFQFVQRLLQNDDLNTLIFPILIRAFGFEISEMIIDIV